MKKNNNVEINRIIPDIICKKCGEQLKFSDNLCGTWINKKFKIDIICPRCNESFNKEMVISILLHGNTLKVDTFGYNIGNEPILIGNQANQAYLNDFKKTIKKDWKVFKDEKLNPDGI